MDQEKDREENPEWVKTILRLKERLSSKNEGSGDPNQAGAKRGNKGF